MIFQGHDGATLAISGTLQTEWIDIEGIKDLATWIKLGTGSTSVQVDLLCSPNPAWSQNTAASTTGTYTTVNLASSVGSTDMTEYDTSSSIPESCGSVSLLLTETGGSAAANVTSWFTGRDLYP